MLKLFMLSITNLQLFEQVCMSVTRCFAKLDMLAPLVITDLKHCLQTDLVSMGLSLLSCHCHATVSHVCLALLCDCLSL